MKRRVPLVVAVGIALVTVATQPLWWLISAHAADQLVTVWSMTTLTTYATELFVQTNTVGTALTALAWSGLALVVVGVAWPFVKPALGYGPVVEA